MKEEQTFETALDNLEKIVKELENGNIDLDNAIKKYTEAMQLSKFCSEKLKDATDKVNKILKILMSKIAEICYFFVTF